MNRAARAPASSRALHETRAAHVVAAIGVMAAAAASTSCTDPVYDSQIQALGDEAPNVPTGDLHRPGQPCVLCHSSTGPASSRQFAIAGTVFTTLTPPLKPEAAVEILMVDANGSSPKKPIFSNAAGNFFVDTQDWPELAFPVKVQIYKQGLRRPMVSHISREPSCAGCHAIITKFNRLTSVGPVYLSQ